MEPEVVFWGLEDEEYLSCYTLDEVMERIFDECYPDPFPEKVTVCGYAREKIDPSILEDSLIGHALEYLDEEYGDPDGGYTEPTENMKKAERTFIEAILKEYESWTCKAVCKEEIIVADWIKKNHPEWLEEKHYTEHICGDRTEE
jgi:hypothetical protein